MLVVMKVEHEIVHLEQQFLMLCTTTVLALSNMQMVVLHTSSRKPNTAKDRKLRISNVLNYKLYKY